MPPFPRLGGGGHPEAPERTCHLRPTLTNLEAQLTHRDSKALPTRDRTTPPCTRSHDSTQGT